MGFELVRESRIEANKRSKQLAPTFWQLRLFVFYEAVPLGAASTAELRLRSRPNKHPHVLENSSQRGAIWFDHPERAYFLSFVRNKERNTYVLMYGPGEAILVAPFLLVGHLLTRILGETPNGWQSTKERFLRFDKSLELNWRH